jgi:hypothetical protein
VLGVDGSVSHLSEAQMIAVDGDADITLGRSAGLRRFALNIGQKPIRRGFLEFGAVLGAFEEPWRLEFDNDVVVTAVLLRPFGVKVDIQSRLKGRNPSNPDFFLTLPGLISP